MTFPFPSFPRPVQNLRPCPCITSSRYVLLSLFPYPPWFVVSFFFFFFFSSSEISLLISRGGLSNVCFPHTCRQPGTGIPFLHPVSFNGQILQLRWTPSRPLSRSIPCPPRLNFKGLPFSELAGACPLSGFPSISPSFFFPFAADAARPFSSFFGLSVILRFGEVTPGFLRFSPFF